MYRAPEFSGFIFWRRNADKVAIVKLERAFEIVVQCRYIHDEFIQHPADKIIFRSLDFRGHPFAEWQCIEGRLLLFGNDGFFNGQSVLIEDLGDEYRWFQFLPVVAKL